MEEKVVDFEVLVEYIENKTGLTKAQVEDVLDAETCYLIENGIIEE